MMKTSSGYTSIIFFVINLVATINRKNMANTIKNILKEFAQLQHGNHWTDNSFKQVLHGVDYRLAGKIAPGTSNSIWMLVSHIIYWRTTVVNRLTGSSNPPPFTDFRLPDELNEQNWLLQQQDFESAYHLLRNAIVHFNEDNLDKPSIKKEQTNFEMILGCLQHDAYHLGQMMLLKKL